MTLPADRLVGGAEVLTLFVEGCEHIAVGDGQMMGGEDDGQ